MCICMHIYIYIYICTYSFAPEAPDPRGSRLGAPPRGGPRDPRLPLLFLLS